MDEDTRTETVMVECFVKVDDTSVAAGDAESIVRAALATDDRIYLAKASRTVVLVGR